MTTIATASSAGGAPSRRAAGRPGVGAYLALVAGIAGAAQAAMLASGRPLEDQAPLVLLMMAAPSIGAIVVTRVRGERLPAGTFRIGARTARRWYLLAWLLPVAVGGVAYGLAWVTGRAALDGGTGLATVGASLAVSLTIVLPFSALTALGEEVGWRGYLLPRLVDAQVARPVAVTNLIWWLFHLPLVLGGLYASGRVPALAALVFGVAVAAVGSVASWSRLATGSVWPAVLLHASWNSVIQGTFDEVTAGVGPRSAETLWVGESGLLVAVAAAIAAALVARARRS
jgi:membrane protease YdiL (CAAX protease family)